MRQSLTRVSRRIHRDQIERTHRRERLGKQLERERERPRYSRFAFFPKRKNANLDHRSSRRLRAPAHGDASPTPRAPRAPVKTTNTPRSRPTALAARPPSTPHLRQFGASHFRLKFNLQVSRESGKPRARGPSAAPRLEPHAASPRCARERSRRKKRTLKRGKARGNVRTTMTPFFLLSQKKSPKKTRARKTKRAPQTRRAEWPRARARLLWRLLGRSRARARPARVAPRRAARDLSIEKRLARGAESLSLFKRKRVF